MYEVLSAMRQARTVFYAWIKCYKNSLTIDTNMAPGNLPGAFCFVSVPKW